MAVELFIHKMSEHMQTARIVQWRVKEGETVEQFQILMDVETDKATAELESPAAGVLKGIRPGVVDGAEVNVGEVIAYIAAPDEVVPSLPPLGLENFPSTLGREATKESISPVPSGEGWGEGIRATPVARRLAKELGIDLSQVKGSGPEFRIKEEDVRAFVEARAHGVPQPAERMPASLATTLELTHNQHLTGQRMLESVQNIPQFALSLSADMTQAFQLRESFDQRSIAEQTASTLQLSGQPKAFPSITAILVKVTAEALKHHPRANATFKGDHIDAHPQINIGVALASGGDLVAPVIRAADQKSLREIALQIETFQEKSKQMRFTLEDLSGGTFTLSNLGMYGIERFNAILIPGQSAILAVGNIIKTPIGLEDGTITLHPIISLTLTVDHRVLDGVQGAQFLNEVKRLLENSSFLD